MAEAGRGRVPRVLAPPSTAPAGQHTPRRLPPPHPLAARPTTPVIPKPVQPAALSAAPHLIREALPPDGLFANQTWRIAPAPFPLSAALAGELESLGRVLLQFYRAVNLLYRRSVEGQQPTWVAEWLDRGKPRALVELQRAPAFKQELPRVIRPDILLTDDGFCITELDSVPGGIGLTAWLNETYSRPGIHDPRFEVIGGARGMLDGFAGIFGDAPRVRLVISEESAVYRPEMVWLASRLGARFTVHDARFEGFADGDAVYRFFELFDLDNVPSAGRLFELAAAGDVVLYCSCPNEATSAHMALRLRRVGIHKVRPLAGGLQGWLAAGLPVEPLVAPSTSGADSGQSAASGLARAFELERR